MDEFNEITEMSEVMEDLVIVSNIDIVNGSITDKLVYMDQTGTLLDYLFIDTYSDEVYLYLEKIINNYESTGHRENRGLLIGNLTYFLNKNLINASLFELLVSAYDEDYTLFNSLIITI